MNDQEKAKAAVEWVKIIIGHNSKAKSNLLELLRPVAEGKSVIVPIEPTEKMIKAGWIDKEDVDPSEIYAAMIAAKEGE